MRANPFLLLRRRRFVPLFFAQFLGALNDCVFKNAIVILFTYGVVKDSTYDAQTIIAIAGGIFMLPFFLFSATAGQLADKYDRAALSSKIKLVEMILAVIAGLSLYSQNVWFLLVALFLMGTHSTFFGPIKYAILPDLLAEDELVAGNGLVEAGTFLAILAGTVLGGLLILNSHGETIVAITMLFIAGIGLACSWFIPKTESAEPKLQINYNFVIETYRVVKYSLRSWQVSIATLGISWFWLIGATFLTEFSTIAKEILGANEEVVTLFLALFTIGMALGSLLCNSFLRGRVNASSVPLGALGMTLFTADLFFACQSSYLPHYTTLIGVAEFISYLANWRIIVDVLLIAACGGLYIVPLYAILQKCSDKTHRARIIAANNIINSLFMVIGALATLLLLALGCTVMQVFLVIAVSNALVGVYICKLIPELSLKSLGLWALKFSQTTKSKAVKVIERWI